MKIKTATGEVIDLDKVRALTATVVQDYLGKNSAGEKITRCVCNRCEAAKSALAILDALQAALSVEEKSPPLTQSIILADRRGGWNDCRNAIRQAVGVVEDAT